MEINRREKWRKKRKRVRFEYHRALNKWMTPLTRWKGILQKILIEKF
jgi:hypothetical protein